MGGVDNLDANVGRYKIRLKSKKWYLRIFYHLFDLCVINAWLLYQRVAKEKNISNMSLIFDPNNVENWIIENTYA